MPARTWSTDRLVDFEIETGLPPMLPTQLDNYRGRALVEMLDFNQAIATEE